MKAYGRFLHILTCFLLCPAINCSVLRAEDGPETLIHWQGKSVLQKEVEFLTDSLMQGRGFGTGPNQLASFYLLKEFRNAGLNTSVQSFREGGKIGHNIVGITPGFFDNYIVVGAYYDGLGRIEDSIYPGADSNASGTAALLSLARSLSKLCDNTTGLIFVAFDGHNANLSGSREFLARYIMRYHISLMVNIDILGTSLAPPRKDRTDYLIALGGIEYSFAIERANKSESLYLCYDYYGSASFTDLFYRRIGDQKWFLNSGIPSVMFTSGITEHTNKKSDLPSSLDYDMLSKRISVIFKWLLSIVS